VIAAAAAGRSQGTLTSGVGRGALTYLASRASAYTHAQSGAGPLFPGRAGQLIVAVAAGDESPTAFGGLNLVAELQATYDSQSGAYATTAQEGFSSGAASTINQLWAILGLAAAQQPVPSRASDFLISLQEADGGWGFGSGGDVDTTALVVQALIASGNVAPDHARVQAGLTFLRQSQAPTGGWAAFGTLSADSTAVAIQALAAAGYVPTGPSWLTASGRTPQEDLIGLQAADGSFGGNALGTADAIAGLAEAALPIYGRPQRARLALTWLAGQQNADGSWSGFSGPSAGATADALLAFAAAGVDPSTVRKVPTGPSGVDYLAASAAAYTATGPDSAGKLALAVAAAGRDPRSFGGLDLVQAINAHYRADQGAFGDRGNTWHQSLAILGLIAAGQSAPAAAVQTLRGLQQPEDGGWKYDLSPGEFNTTSPDNTGIALQALGASGLTSTDGVVAAGLTFLQRRQDAAAGWANANSTALAIQGLIGGGVGFAGELTKGGVTPYEALASYQKRDGPFFYDPSLRADSLLATSQAVPALLGLALPIRPSGPLTAFGAVPRPPDPDRLLAGAPRGIVGPGGVDVIVPFGGDLNANASVALSYRFEGGSYQSLPLTRADGYFTATIPSRQPGRYDLRATYQDADGQQGGAEQSGSATVLPYSVRLPVLARQALLAR
jgi:prenyltransferase beta subunit